MYVIAWMCGKEVYENSRIRYKAPRNVAEQYLLFLGGLLLFAGFLNHYFAVECALLLLITHIVYVYTEESTRRTIR